jgi:hypothetical protein
MVVMSNVAIWHNYTCHLLVEQTPLVEMHSIALHPTRADEAGGDAAEFLTAFVVDDGN